MPRKPSDAVVRFWSHVSRGQPVDCWPWTGYVCAGGYGRFAARCRPTVLVQAHRFAYETEIGPIPVGLDLDHLCRNRRCVNPTHLEPVTRRTNVMRGMAPHARAARAGICKRGHALDGARIATRVDGRQYRSCRHRHHLLLYCR